jgi:hypothetical protein
MAEGSRPFSKQYEGQRVSTIPDGFLQAYAQVGANIQGTGKAIGEGIGGAIAAYKENQQKHEIADGTARASFAKAGDINAYLDAKIKATPKDVIGKAADLETQDPAALAYRALIDAKDTLTKDISGWTDKSLTQKTVSLGRITMLSKFADEYADDQAKRTAAGAAAGQFAQQQAGRDAATLLARQKYMDESRGLRSADTLAGARNMPAAVKAYKGGQVGMDANFVNAFQTAKNNLQAQIAATAPADTERLDALKSEDAFITEKFAQALAQASVAVTGADQETIATKALMADPTQASRRLADIDGRIKDLTDKRGAPELLPAPVKEEIRILQLEKKELSTALSTAEIEAKKTGAPAVLKYEPTTIALKHARDVNAFVAANAWETNMRAQDLPVTPEAKMWVYQMAHSDGETTADGYDISVDKTTGAIKRDLNPNFVEWLKNKPDGSNLTGEAAENYHKWVSNTAARGIKLSAQTFGTASIDGLSPIKIVHDMDTGRHSLFVKGQMLLNETESLKVKEEIRTNNDLMYSLGQINNLLKKKTADGKGVEFKQVTRPSTEEERRANPALGPTITVDEKGEDGRRIAVLRNFGDMSNAEKQQFSTAVASFIRIKAKGLGVLSKTDWDYLRTLAPDIGSQFPENFNLKEESAVKILSQAILSRGAVAPADFVSRASQQMGDITASMRNTLSSIPATGTDNNMLEVSAGAATRVDGGRYYGKDLSNWWETITSAKTDGRTYNNEWFDLRSEMSVALVNRNKENGPSAGPLYYRQKLAELSAVLNNSGLDPEQIDQIMRKYTH